MSPLDKDLLDFISRHVDTVATLEVVLLLSRSPETFWAPAAVAERIGISAETASSVAGRLHAGGLLARASATSAFRFSPRDPADRTRVDALTALYDTARAAVLAAIRSRGLNSQTSGDGVRA